MAANSQEAEIQSIFEQGLRAHNAGDADNAKKLYQKTLSLQAHHPEANHNIGTIFFAKNQLVKALKFFKSALDTSPNVSFFWTSYIETLVALKRFDEAKELIKKLENANIRSEKFKTILEQINFESTIPDPPKTKTLQLKEIDYEAEIAKQPFDCIEKKDGITLSICIPTYNRARYLEVLLNDLHKELQAFPFRYEIVISDDCSQDNTEDIVRHWSSRLPIIYEKQKQNIGSLQNMDAAYSSALGTFAMYLADDDFIGKDELIKAILMLIAHPEAVVLYAPNKLIEHQNKRSDKQFYYIPKDIILDQFDYTNLLNLILDHRIFPEVLIFRLEAYKQSLPTTNGISYWAFTKATEWLSLGQIIFKKEPFYYSSISYFKNEERVQLGNEETEYAWDRYRGGLEYILSFLVPHLNVEEKNVYRTSIDQFVQDRMWAGLKLRLLNGRNPVDNYYLAARVCAMMDKDLLPYDYKKIRSAAAIWYLGNDPLLLKRKEAIVLIGFDESMVEIVSAQSCVPVFTEQTYLGEYENSIILHKENSKFCALDHSLEARGNNTILTESMLMTKFI